MADLPKPALAGRPYANYFSVLRELTNTGDNILKYLRSNLLNLLDGALMPHLRPLTMLKRLLDRFAELHPR